MARFFLLLFLIHLSMEATTQTALLQGSVIDAISRKPVSNANILVQGYNISTHSDSSGKWSIEIKPGLYNIQLSHVSYETKIIYENRVHTSQQNVVDTELFRILNEMSEITISVPAVTRSAENGNNIKTLEIDEIQRMPGAVMDISKVIKNFPGVSPKVSFGYNLIVRGGGSFENTYYLDGIEIPAITHFAVQGLSGGPNGLLNTDMISRITFKTGSFPVNHGNSLSSVMELDQKAGRRDRLGAKLTLGAAEYGIQLEGPITKHSSYNFSARKSYTEYLLKAFDLPVLPAFTDFQYKHNFWLANKDQLTIIGLGAFDKYWLNFDAKATDAVLYNTGYIPEGNQATTVVGAHYKHFTEKGIYRLIVSHNRFSNIANKYYDNSGLPEDISLDYKSKHHETKFQLENTMHNRRSKVDYGIAYDFVDFKLDQFNIFANNTGQIDTLDFNSSIKFQKYGFFGSYSYTFNTKWNAYMGFRIDGNNFGKSMTNPFKQFSPRLSVQYHISKKISLTIQSGIYYQLPPTNLLAYKENGVLINQHTMKYIRSSQISSGIDYKIDHQRRITIDLFYKHYDQYPFLLRDSISFANAAGDYVAVGNQQTNSDSKGRAYGAEFFFQQKLKNNWFSNVSLSYIVSEFEDKNGKLVNSTWDNRLYANLTIGRKLKNNWTIGGKFTYAGSNPYTPYNQNVSASVTTWDANRKGIYDFDRLNQERLPAFHSLDVRFDKKWFLKHATIIAFLDIQNLYNNSFQLVPYLTVVRDEEGVPLIDQNDPTRYETQIINSDTGRVLPTIGFSIEF